MVRRTIPRSASKRALIKAGTPIYDTVVADLNFDPAATYELPKAKHATPATVAAAATRRKKATAATQ